MTGPFRRELRALRSRLSVRALELGSAALSIAICGGCTTTAPPTTPTATRAPSATSAVTSEAAPAVRLDIEERADLQRHFDAERVTGTIALFDSARGRLACSDLTACQSAVIPASTFKIPNALIALETGVVEDSETIIRWDGQPRVIAEWNQDHTLRTAMRVSCVPCFQWIARSVGSERMSEWVNRFDYGNHDLSGGIDRFWLTGGLRISPVQQIEFLRRLDAGKLGASERSLEIVRDIIALDVGQNHVLRGKTGLARAGDAGKLAAWFVGWVELEERRVFFATLIDSAPSDLDLVPFRRRFTERVLKAEGLLPD